MSPTVFGYCTPLPGLAANDEPVCKRAATASDVRWLNGRIKSISLLGNILAALEAARHGGDEAILLRETARGTLVSEGTYTNIFLATGPRGDEIVTPSLDSAPMLRGITRDILLCAVPSIIERPVLAAELATASEIMLVGTTTMVTSVVELDGRRVGATAGPGTASRRLLQALVEAIRAGRDEG